MAKWNVFKKKNKKNKKKNEKSNKRRKEKDLPTDSSEDSSSEVSTADTSEDQNTQNAQKNHIKNTPKENRSIMCHCGGNMVKKDYDYYCQKCGTTIIDQQMIGHNQIQSILFQN
jgi:DNA mismatch repair ATPase MutL